MAQGLQRTDSPGRVRRAARRHLRLAKRTGDPRAIPLAARIVPPAEDLERRIGEALAAGDATQDAFDDWVQEDTGLDQTVSSIFRKADDWDADHPNAGTANLLFHGKASSEVTRMPRQDEPDEVARIVKRGEGLPQGHPAAQLLATLNERAGTSRNAHRAWIDAVQRQGVADAAVDVARLAVVRAYNDNIIDITRASGEAVAELCFPVLRRAPRVDEDEAAAPGPAAGTP